VKIITKKCVQCYGSNITLPWFKEYDCSTIGLKMYFLITFFGFMNDLNITKCTDKLINDFGMTITRQTVAKV
jgi:hypothetical protein